MAGRHGPSPGRYGVSPRLAGLILARSSYAQLRSDPR
jgi:hypothetical protein